MTNDPVLDALDGLVEALRANIEDSRAMIRRAETLRRARKRGAGYREVVTAEDRPLIVEMLRDSQERVGRAGGRFRREEAAALRAEGLTLDEVAALFGVTRQRVIAVLKDR